MQSSPSSASDGRYYRYRCTQEGCGGDSHWAAHGGADWLIDGAYCAACKKFTQARWVATEQNLQGPDARPLGMLQCVGCQSVWAEPSLPRPEACLQCGSTHGQWCKEDDQWWPPIPDEWVLAHQGEGVMWLHGELEGDIDADQFRRWNSHSSQAASFHRKEGITLHDALFPVQYKGVNEEGELIPLGANQTVQRVSPDLVKSFPGHLKRSVPPAHRYMPPPLHFVRLEKVKVRFDPAQPVAELALHDVRMYDWTLTHDQRIGEGQVLARLKGKAFACISRELEQPPPLLSKAKLKEAFKFQFDSGDCPIWPLLQATFLLWLACGWQAALSLLGLGLMLRWMASRWKIPARQVGMSWRPVWNFGLPFFGLCALLLYLILGCFGLPRLYLWLLPLVWMAASWLCGCFSRQLCMMLAAAALYLWFCGQSNGECLKPAAIAQQLQSKLEAAKPPTPPPGPPFQRQCIPFSASESEVISQAVDGFGSNRDEVGQSQKEYVQKEILPYIKAAMQSEPDRREPWILAVIGLTDAQQRLKHGGNQQLSLDRANKMRAFLESEIPDKRLKIEADGMADRLPYFKDSPKKAWACNRRVLLLFDCSEKEKREQLDIERLASENPARAECKAESSQPNEASPEVIP